MSNSANPTACPLLSARFVAASQGVFYAVTGLWPWIHGDSFQAITGYKADFWLAQIVGLLLVIIGVVLTLAARADRLTREWVLLGVFSAVALIGADIHALRQPSSTRAYLLDVVAEVGILVGWSLTRLGNRPARFPDTRSESVR